MQSTKELYTDKELLESTLEHLDNALAYAMEIQSKEGQALAHFLHSSMVYGESIEGPDEDAH